MVKLKPYDIVIIGLFTAIITISKTMLDFLPNIELVSFLLILLTLTYGIKTLFIATNFSIICSFLYGFGDWIIMYLILWNLLVLIVLLLKPIFKENFLLISLFSGLWGLVFGWFFALEWCLLYGINAGIVYWSNGFIYDAAHMIGNYFIMLIIGESIYKILKRRF